MKSKFVIFIAVSALIVAPIYSISTQYVSAARNYTTCGKHNPVGSGVYTVNCCKIEEDDEGKITSAKCYTLVCKENGGCVQSEKIAPKINPEQFGGLLEENNSDTKGLRTDLLQKGELPPLTSNDNKTKVQDHLGDLNDLPKLSPGQ
jgi:hypothetical protein